MSTTHTPGPWSVVETADGKPYSKNWREISPGVVGAASYTINRWGESQEVIGVRISEANARLIAAAPELFAALEAAAEWISDHTEEMPDGHLNSDAVLSDARQALRKAKP